MLKCFITPLILLMRLCLADRGLLRMSSQKQRFRGKLRELYDAVSNFVFSLIANAKLVDSARQLSLCSYELYLGLLAEKLCSVALR